MVSEGILEEHVGVYKVFLVQIKREFEKNTVFFLNFGYV